MTHAYHLVNKESDNISTSIKVVSIFFLVPVVNGIQSCYSSCNQQISFNTTLQRPTNCQAHSNSTIVCAVSVTFSSDKENTIDIFYFDPSILSTRPSFVETQVSLSARVVRLHIFHECPDCDIFEQTRTIISLMQPIPKQSSVALSRMRELLPLDNTTLKPIECYKGDNENETFHPCQSCLLEINSTSATRSYKNHIDDSLGVKLNEKTSLDNKRAFKILHLECVQSRCNTKNTAQKVLRVLADVGLAQHFYDLSSSSATVFSYSILYIVVQLFILGKTI